MAPKRITLATLPTPLEQGGVLDSRAKLWIKRDDLTGLGVGGNKARKLEYLCGQAIDDNASCLVTVGAAQSNHCRMTAAAGTRIGLPVHLVVSGDKPQQLEGNQLLATMFGATLHHTGFDHNDWASLDLARLDLTAKLIALGEKPHSIPIGGSTAVGALGYVVAYTEIIEQCAANGFAPRAIVFTTSSGGTHAGLVAGKVIARANNQNKLQPDVIGIGVAKGNALDSNHIVTLANQALELLNVQHQATDQDVVIDDDYLGGDYAQPTHAATQAAIWAAHRGAWVLDPIYSAKGFSGLLGRDASGVWTQDDNIVFIHTGGLPSIFVTH